jgi:hypothetical protein
MSDVVDVSAFFNRADGSVITMRTTPGDNPRVSAIDFAMAVTGQNNDRAGETIRNLRKADPEWWGKIQKFKFTGSGQTSQRVLCAAEAIDVLSVLPGKVAKAYRGHCFGLLARLFAGDPTLHDVLKKYNVVNDATTSLCEFLEDATPAVQAAVALEEKDNVHDACKAWIGANINCISFVTAVCPKCSTLTTGLSLKGGIVALEAIVPRTNYRADVLVKLDDATYVSVEVAHTHLISAKKMSECEEAGTIVYEVETDEIERAITEQTQFSSAILHTTCKKFVLCTSCTAAKAKKRRFEEL